MSVSREDRDLNGRGLSEVWEKIKTQVSTLASGLGTLQASLGSAAYRESDEFASAEDLGVIRDYFDGSGNARAALKLTTVSKTAWGQTYWTSGGVPDTISGDMSNVGDISFSASGKNIGSMLYFDTTNGRLGIGISVPTADLHISRDTLIEKADSYTPLTIKGMDSNATTKAAITFRAGTIWLGELGLDGINANAPYFRCKPGPSYKTYKLYNEGNANLSTVDWAAKDVNAAGHVSALGGVSAFGIPDLSID